jgi:hypothetical protein
MDPFMNWLRCCLFLGLALFAVAARTQDPVPEETILRRQHVVLPVLESRSSDIPLAAAYQALSDRAFMAAVRAYRAELAAYLREEAPVIDLGDGGDVFYDSVLMEDDIFPRALRKGRGRGYRHLRSGSRCPGRGSFRYRVYQFRRAPGCAVQLFHSHARGDHLRG